MDVPHDFPTDEWTDDCEGKKADAVVRAQAGAFGPWTDESRAPRNETLQRKDAIAGAPVDALDQVLTLLSVDALLVTVHCVDASLLGSSREVSERAETC